ncbi:tripartite tricarboxylate transporter substrate-binding protein, partial [Bacillus safensis]|nr:tripartite tricarboxylate transporter substrate-binding protein [Bacillus safensis]
MPRSPIKLLAHMAGGAVLLATMAPVAAQSFPVKPITIVVPYVPGGNIDTTARLMGRAMGETLKQPVVVDNRAGAGGIIGA